MAKSEKNKDVLELDAEDMGVDGKIEVGEQLGKAIKQEIARFDPFEVKLNELKERYSGLTIVDVEDKSGYEDVRLAVADLRSIRTGTAKDKAIIKAPFLAACKTIEDRAKWIIEEVEKIEDPLDKRKKQIDTERDAIKAAKKAQQERDFITRTLVLTKLGAEFNGVSFKLGEVEYDSIAVKESDTDIWETLILPKYQEIFDAAEVVRLAAEKEKAAAAAELLRQQQELAAKEAEMKQREETMRLQQEAIDKQKKERQEEMDRKIAADRTALQSKRLNELLPFNPYGADIDMATLWAVSEFEYQKVLTEKKAAFEKKQADDKIWQEEQRIKVELQAKIDAEAREKAAAEKAINDERERVRLENEAKLKAQQEAAIKKQQELDAANDKTKWADLMKQLESINVPEFRSSQYRTKAKVVRDFLADIKTNN